MSETEQGWGWARLRRWLAEDYEGRVVEMQVTAECPQYGEADDEVLRQDFVWMVTASEMTGWADQIDGQSDSPHQSCQHTGYGETLDKAAVEVLRCIRELAA